MFRVWGGGVCFGCVSIVARRVAGLVGGATVGVMSRPPRIEVAGGVYHVVARGNERRSVFRDDADRARFLEVLGRVGRRYRWRVLSFCLMGNHYHLLVRIECPNLAAGMRQLNGVYAQGFNRRHGRVGHLFQGRYKAVLVQTDGHLLSAVRYIVRNPLRAGLSTRVDGWRWTSHAQTVSLSAKGVVAVADVLSYLAADARAARRRYLELVSGEAEAPGRAHPLIDGDDAFIERHLAAIDSDPEYPRAQVRPRRVPLAELVSSRDDPAAIARAHSEHGYSMRELATHLGCGVTTIHRRIRQNETQAAEDPATR